MGVEAPVAEPMLEDEPEVVLEAEEDEPLLDLLVEDDAILWVVSIRYSMH